MPRRKASHALQRTRRERRGCNLRVPCASTPKELRADTDVPAIISAVSRRYPSERLSWAVRPDPLWGFLERYAKEYF
jgi:hypothetical protein